MKPRILLVSTYSSLASKAVALSKELNIPISVYEGGFMKNGHIYAKGMESHYDCIISQGGTASVIREMVNIPVITLSIGLSDFLDAYKRAKKFKEKIGLVLHEKDNIKAFYDLKELLKIEFKLLSYSNDKDLRKEIIKATKNERLTLMAMGSCVIEIANSMGLNSVLITSCEEEIKNALLKGKAICDLTARDKEKNNWLTAIVDNTAEGIIALDKDGRIITINPTAEKILNLNRKEVINKNFSEIDKIKILYEDGSNGLGKICSIGENKLVLSRKPLIVEGEEVGLLFSFHEASVIINTSKRVKKELYLKGRSCKYTLDDIIGKSQKILDTIERAKKYAKTDTTILIEGETGTGKELFAQGIHSHSDRSLGPFIAVNCAALPESLLESELFGYEEGAFTGAKKGGKQGLFELADGGTIFLDEIGEISPRLQCRLLRVLEEREVMRVGGESLREVDVRVIVATNEDLYTLVEKGDFREDLYFRLNVLNLKIPPLRERKEDIPLIISHYLEKMKREDTKVKEISPEGMELIKNYPWPGNVRELVNFIEKLVILSDTELVQKDFVEKLLGNDKDCGKIIPLKKDEKNNNTISIKIGNLKSMELQIIDSLMEKFNHDKGLLAQQLGISRTTLWKRMKELKVDG